MRFLADPFVRIVLVGALCGAAFLVFLGYRTDYVGHALAGYGGTLLLLAVAVAASHRPLRWEAVGVAVLSIGLGAVVEATIFQIAIFDPVDFFNQSIGACLAAAVIVDRPLKRGAGWGLVLVALLFLALGFRYAFS